MTEAHNHRAAIIIAAVMIAVAAAMIFDGRGLAPGPFEPIGSGTVPSGVAAIVIGLGAGVLWQAARGLRAGAVSSTETVEIWWRPIGAFALTVIYALVLASGFVRYQWATLVFFIVVTLAVADRPRQSLFVAAPLGAILAFGLDYMFRRVLVADLP